MHNISMNKFLLLILIKLTNTLDDAWIEVVFKFVGGEHVGEEFPFHSSYGFTDMRVFKVRFVLPVR